jgi:hypothetical protein
VAGLGGIVARELVPARFLFQGRKKAHVFGVDDIVAGEERRTALRCGARSSRRDGTEPLCRYSPRSQIPLGMKRCSLHWPPAACDSFSRVRSVPISAAGYTLLSPAWQDAQCCAKSGLPAAAGALFMGSGYTGASRL